ncbi:hypothetical protein D3C85_1848610 [compost metagenome]
MDDHGRDQGRVIRATAPNRNDSRRPVFGLLLQTRGIVDGLAAQDFPAHIILMLFYEAVYGVNYREYLITV